MGKKHMRARIESGEEVAYSGRPHGVVLLVPMAAMFLLAIADAVMLWRYSWLGVLIKLAGLVLLVLAGLNYVARYLAWRSIEFVVTSRRVISASGVLTYHSREIPLDRISEISATATLAQRMLRIGTLTISSTGDDPNLVLKYIFDPVQVRGIINQAIEARRVRVELGTTQSFAVPASPSDGSHPLEQLSRLGDLYSRGLISREEFEVAKAELLRRI